MDCSLKMQTNKEIANFFWHGNPLSLYEIKCLESFVKKNFIVNLWCFKEFKVPDGVNLCDANKFYKEEDIQTFVQKKKVGCLAAFSDAFRYEVLENQPGWWFDTDCICLKDQTEFKTLYADRKIIAGFESLENINGAVLNIPDKEILQKIKLRLTEILLTRNRRIGWGEIGPRLITQIVKDFNLEKDIFSTNYFYPITSKNALIVLDPNEILIVNEKCKDSFIYHYWSEMFSRANVNKNEMPPLGSFLYEKFKE